MITLDDLLASKYAKHGRELPYLDCWGLARLAWSGLFGKQELPSYSHIDPDDKASLTKYKEVVRDGFSMRETPPRHGTLATGWRGRRCIHVGAVVEVDGRLWVLETDEPTNAVLTQIKVFEARYSKVIYYDN